MLAGNDRNVVAVNSCDLIRLISVVLEVPQKRMGVDCRQGWAYTVGIVSEQR